MYNSVLDFGMIAFGLYSIVYRRKGADEAYRFWRGTTNYAAYYYSQVGFGLAAIVMGIYRLIWK